MTGAALPTERREGNEIWLIWQAGSGGVVAAQFVDVPAGDRHRDVVPAGGADDGSTDGVQFQPSAALRVPLHRGLHARWDGVEEAHDVVRPHGGALGPGNGRDLTD